MQVAQPLNAEWDNDAEGYDALRKSWLNKRRDLYTIDFLTRAPAGSKVIELGSGTGSSLIELAQKRPDMTFIGIEPLKNYCEYGSRKADAIGLGNIEFLCGYGESLSVVYGDRPKADFVISTDVLHHVEDLKLTAQQLSQVTSPTAQWLSFEPSYLNPYIFYYQATAAGERNFWPRKFLKAATGTWKLESKNYITIIPSFIPEPPALLMRIERALEGIPFLCGRLVSVFAKPQE